MLPLALIVALVCMMQTSAVLRAYPSHPDGPRHMARDFGGIGAGCILASLIGGFAVNASPPSTAVVVSAGGGSKAVSVTAAILAVALLAGGGGLLAYVPHAALGAILIAVALRIMRVKQMLDIARRGGSEIWLVAASTLLVVGLPIQTGMLASIVLSLLHSFYTVARPLCLELARAPGTTVWWPPQGEAGDHEPGLLVFAPAAPLNFTNAAFIHGRLTARDRAGAHAGPNGGDRGQRRHRHRLHRRDDGAAVGGDAAETRASRWRWRACQPNGPMSRLCEPGCWKPSDQSACSARWRMRCGRSRRRPAERLLSQCRQCCRGPDIGRHVAAALTR